MAFTFSDLVNDMVDADHIRFDPVLIGSLQHRSFPSVFVRRAHFVHLMNKLEKLTEYHRDVPDLRIGREKAFLDKDVDGGQECGTEEHYTLGIPLGTIDR